MKIKILEDMNISGRLDLDKGTILEAVCSPDFVFINADKAGIIKAPKEEFEDLVSRKVIGILEED